MGFVGVYATATQGLVISDGDADKLTIILNLVYNPEWVTALVIAGAISAGLSTLSGNLLAVGALISQDVIATLKPNIPQRRRWRIGCIAIVAGGLGRIV